MIHDPIQKHQSDEPPRHRYWATATGVVLACVIVLAAYPAMKRGYASLSSIPGLTQAVAGLRDQIQRAEQNAADASTAQQSSLREEADRLARDMRGRIEAASKRAADSAQQMYVKLQERVDVELKNSAERLAGLSERVDVLESSGATQQSQIAQLRREVGALHDTTVQQAGELARLRNEMADASSDTTSQIGSLRRNEERDHQDIEGVNTQLATKRIPFEAARNHVAALGDGVSLRVSATDVAYRRVSGWMWLSSDARTIWLNHQSALEPVIFYGYRDGARRELVITNVTRNSVTGYLVVPASPGAEAGGGE